MLEMLTISIGLVLVIEGIIYFLIADKLENLISFLKNYDVKKIQIIGLIFALIGLCLIYLTFRYYGNLK